MYFEGKKLVLEYNLQFFAKDGPGGEKTEPASSKKLNEARKKGQVAKSKELVSAVSLFVLFMIIKIYVPKMGTSLKACFYESYQLISLIIADGRIAPNNNLLLTAIGETIIDIILLILPIMLIVWIVIFLTTSVQFKWKVTTEPLKPDLSKFNPISGFKRMFSFRQVVELLKSVAMILVIAYVVYNTLVEKYDVLFTFYDITMEQSILVIWDLIVEIGMDISLVFIIIGFVDLFYQKHKFKEDMKMTKQETKDEYKQTEGDPQVKGQIRSRMRAASRRRMMQALPEADVVITNPTHFAVALKYDTNVSAAPIVIAKGADHLAFQIKEKAKEYKIEIVENKPLARLLYNNVEVGAEIPPELYQAVAEVLAFVYSLHNKI